MTRRSDHLYRCLACAAVMLAPAICLAQPLQQQIDAIFDALPSHTLTGRVESEDGSVVYYTKNSATVLKPASVMKTLTVGTALAKLGGDHQFVTRVYRNGTIDGNGILQGDLNLLGDHDFTWSVDYYPDNSRFPLDQLAKKLYALGLRSVNGTVRGYGEMLYNEVNGLTDPTNAFRDALVAAGITASATATSTSFTPPGTWMAEWRSLPLSQACRDMIKPSNNEYADSLLRHIGWVISGTNTGSAGGQVVKDFLTSKGINMSGSSISCGSGLCGLLSADQCLGLTRTMLGMPVGWDFCSMLPIGGLDGTLSSRFTSGAASGRVHAKTGTLSDTVCLSGYVDNPVDNKRYLFTFLMNGIGFDQQDARDAIDQAVQLLSGNVNNLQGSVPAAPTLRWVKANPDGLSVTVQWASASGATSYHLYQNTGGFVWPTFINTAATSAGVTVLPGSTNYFMVRAANTFGESKDSDTYGVRIPRGQPHVLIVDGDDRWNSQSENPQGANQQFLIRLSEALPAAVGFDSCANEEVESAAIPLNNYPAVCWILGEESTANESFSATEQSRVQTYLNAGGNLFLSGSEIGWDLDSQGSTADRTFYNNVLKTDFVNDDSGTEVSQPSAGAFASVASDALDFHATWLIVGFPDVLAPLGGATSNLTYIANTGTSAGAAGIQYSGVYRLINLGFPFENIAHLPTRQAMMKGASEFLLNKTLPAEGILETRDTAGTILTSPTYVETGAWSNSVAKSHAPGLIGTGSRFIDYVIPQTGSDHAQITPNISVAGRYELFATWGLGANCFNARYTVRHYLGTTTLLVNQIPTGTAGANCDSWVSLGQYWLESGQNSSKASIDVSEATVTGRPTTAWSQRVYADAFKLVFLEAWPVINVDFDNDGDIDVSDFGHLQQCLTAPNIAATTPSCFNARIDGDTDVDAEDMSWFLPCLQGPNLPADPLCRQQ